MAIVKSRFAIDSSATTEKDRNYDFGKRSIVCSTDLMWLDCNWNFILILQIIIQVLIIWSDRRSILCIRDSDSDYLWSRWVSNEICLWIHSFNNLNFNRVQFTPHFTVNSLEISRKVITFASPSFTFTIFTVNIDAIRCNCNLMRKSEIVLITNTHRFCRASLVRSV